MTMSLLSRHCSPVSQQAPLTPQQAASLLKELQLDWQLDQENKHLVFDFQFKNFHETMAFVNALAWVAHQQDHHPDLEVAYKHCLVRYSTHSIGGLSENDFICAAKIEQLVS